jgi:hypothetical protein
MTIGTGVQLLPREEPGGYLPTALVVVRHRGGVSSVWALARNVGTPRRDDAVRRVDADGERENSKQLICKEESTDARQGGGPPRSSDEGPVTGLEPRGRVVRARSVVNRDSPGGVR